jgi:hypothetical protein
VDCEQVQTPACSGVAEAILVAGIEGIMGALCKEMVGDFRLALILSSLVIEPSLEELELSDSLEPLSVLSVPSLPSLLLVSESRLSSKTTASPGTGTTPFPCLVPCLFLCPL